MSDDNTLAAAGEAEKLLCTCPMTNGNHDGYCYVPHNEKIIDRIASALAKRTAEAAAAERARCVEKLQKLKDDKCEGGALCDPCIYIGMAIDSLTNPTD